jgi:hypothetical protein
MSVNGTTRWDNCFGRTSPSLAQRSHDYGSTTAPVELSAERVLGFGIAWYFSHVAEKGETR